jgi:hypothetical protein
MQDLIQKITTVKRANDMDSVVKHMPSICKTLSSNPRTTKNKKEWKKEGKKRKD